ncbi:exocyst complex component EXO70A3-like isoform X2 [Triticum urartu]|uniref:exocyst complex component EXO70A3-like isoform X2 n=1 Tax=Triticum dicoccoides TaxID=85692 RepID=UPI000E78F474|nr:exocyst complex component EXO70A3-like isoform X2 [Triticum dicoccoides]XP_048550872.1 exocyst complex component EXO70A3-like isoform X2 [Triticum urartu]
MAFPRSPDSSMSSCASTLTLSSCPSSYISIGSSNPSSFTATAIVPTETGLVAPAGHQDQDQDPPESAAKFPKQEINGWEHPYLCSPSKQLKNVSTSIKEISRWARSSPGVKVNSNIRLLESVLSLIQVVTSTAPHPDHIVDMIRVHDALANLLLVLPKNIFPFLVQNFAQIVDELSPKGGASLSARFEKTLHDLRRSIRSGLQDQDGMVEMETLQDAVATLICHLEIMLEKESHRYKDAGLKQMFMVNNVSFVLHQVEGSEIKYLLGEDWVLKHRDQLKDHISRFINISWESVMYCFHAKTNKIQIFSSLPTLQIFNMEFEKTYWTQKTWKVENPLLRSNMRKSVSEKLVQAYSTYLENLKNKAPKLMKYTPEDLEELLSDLFEG